MSASVFVADELRLALVICAVVVTAGLVADVSVRSSVLRSRTQDIVLSILCAGGRRRRENGIGILSLIASLAISVTGRVLKMLEIKSTGSKLLPELLTLAIATLPLDLVTACASVSVEGGSRCEPVTALSANVGAFVPVELVLLALIGRGEHEAVAAHIGAGESFVLGGVWAVQGCVVLWWIIDVLHRFHDG
jgi:hypothetical protein